MARDTRPQGGPILFLIGAQKGGSSIFASQLVQHPEIAFYSIKEPNFFVAGDIAACRSALDAVSRPSDPPRYLLDASVNYTRYPLLDEVPRNIHALCDGEALRFLYILRHPVDRALSEYFWKCERYGEYLPVEEALAGESQYVQSSLYDQQIRRYLEYFDPASFFFVKFDNYFAAPQAEFDAACDWLGLAPCALQKKDAVLGATYKQTTNKPRVAALNQLLYANPRLKGTLKKILPVRTLSKATGMLSKPVPRPLVSEAFRHTLFERHFAQSVVETEKLTGLDLQDWLQSPIGQTG